MNAAALKHLAAVDPVMRRLIREHRGLQAGPGTVALAVSIARAGRRAPAAQRHGGEHDSDAVQKTVSRPEISAPEDLAKVTDEQIRACGFSFAKIKSIRDIAEKPCPASCRRRGKS
jgi:3-methyladenine DNA glycosylase/8-oxoguanine DNA glycosylase